MLYGLLADWVEEIYLRLVRERLRESGERSEQVVYINYHNMPVDSV